MLISRTIIISVLGLYLFHGSVQSAEPVSFTPPGEGPELPEDLIHQIDIENGALNLNAIRKAGGMVFTTPFNRYDGFGDGPPDIFDNTKNFPFRGDRAPLQNGKTALLKINGLDAQSCLECHSVVSRATVPARFGIGGHGGINNTAFNGTQVLDAANNVGVAEGITETTGRVSNPPFIFGAGGIELLAKEMTRDLQSIKALAQNAPSGEEFNLITKGVFFGAVISQGGGAIDIKIDNAFSIDEDLVVRPFARKGENFTIRDFDRGAMAFHFGIQPLDVFESGTDPDGDGVTDELSIGEMSALSIFLATMPRPRKAILSGDGIAGQILFNSIGCAQCHIPALHTKSRILTQSFPDIATDPDANVFIGIDLSNPPSSFWINRKGGLRIPLYADLKRHDMGSELAESTGGAMDPFFTTARLWGIADSAPYLHDGRAATLTEAILAHGGEAKAIRDNFAGLTDQQRIQLLSFLRSLKLPKERTINNLDRFIRN